VRTQITPGTLFEKSKCAKNLLLFQVVGAPDHRGLWLAHTGLIGHIERVEQCGDRYIVSSSEYFDRFGNILKKFRFSLL
jgi:hypothetical protein